MIYRKAEKNKAEAENRKPKEQAENKYWIPKQVFILNIIVDMYQFKARAWQSIFKSDPTIGQLYETHFKYNSIDKLKPIW